MLAALLALQLLAAPAPPPPETQCHVPTLRSPNAFRDGETLDFDLDAVGAQAGKLTLKVLPEKSGLLPVQAHVETNTFFSKVRKVNGTATSYLNPKTLRPTRYAEDAMENDVHKTADVDFLKDHRVKLSFHVGERAGQNELRYGNDALDVAGALYLVRQLQMKEGLEVCFDVYGIRALWRLSGKVAAREHVSSPLGEFESWHLSGEAVRLDDPSKRREVHVWITDDARRLPLAALGMIDLGAVRATLTGFTRPGEHRAKADKMGDLKW